MSAQDEADIDLAEWIYRAELAAIDPTGEALSPMPRDERKRMFDAFDNMGRKPGVFVQEDPLSPIEESESGPSRRVFFPGDTVPGGIWVVSVWGARFAYSNDWSVTITGPLVETVRGVSLLPQEWQDAVDRARADREGE